MRRLLLPLVLLFVTTRPSLAYKLDTISVYSPSMQKDVPCTVVTPDNMLASGDRLPVVYLLHGFSDDYGAWTKPEVVREMADRYSLIVVSPDGGYSSWYWDSPIDSTMRYETFVVDELVPYVDANYPTLASREGRAVTGLSMGGHGAMYLAIGHQDVFGAVGSTSGGVDIRPFPDSWQMKSRIGERDENPERWLEYSVMGQLDKLEDGGLAIIFDCGAEDFFLEVNEVLHRELLRRGVEHRYIVSRGGHNWVYWSESIMYQMLFFDNYFSKNEARK